MRFRLNNPDATGYQDLAGGFGNFFKALAMSPLYEAQAADERLNSESTRRLREAQIGNLAAEAAIRRAKAARMAGAGGVLSNAAAAKAGVTQPVWQDYQIHQQTGLPQDQIMETDTGTRRVPQWDADKLKLLRQVESTFYAPQMADADGNVNPLQLAQAQGEYQKQDTLDAVLSGKYAPSLVGQGMAAMSGKPQFNNVGNTGMGFNLHTGQGSVIDNGLLSIFGDEAKALINQRNASAGASGAAAGLSNARRDRVVGGYEKPVTIMDEESGDATVTRLPTGKDPVSVGVAASKKTGADATLQKERNRVTTQVEKELVGASDEEIAAEVDRRMSRRTSKPGAAQPSKLPSGYTQDKALAEARAAIAKGKDRTAVIQRLRDMGVDTKGL